MFIGMFVPRCNIDNGVENTLFTVSGIMFSIGLGLTSVSSTHGVKNKDYIHLIRANMSLCQSRSISLFLLLTIFYIILSYTTHLPNHILIANLVIPLNYSLAFVLTAIYSIVYFIIIFGSIQKFNNELEDRINKEEQARKK